MYPPSVSSQPSEEDRDTDANNLVQVGKCRALGSVEKGLCLSVYLHHENNGCHTAEVETKYLLN